MVAAGPPRAQDRARLVRYEDGKQLREADPAAPERRRRRRRRRHRRRPQPRPRPARPRRGRGWTVVDRGGRGRRRPLPARGLRPRRRRGHRAAGRAADASSCADSLAAPARPGRRRDRVPRARPARAGQPRRAHARPRHDRRGDHAGARSRVLRVARPAHVSGRRLRPGSCSAASSARSSTSARSPCRRASPIDPADVDDGMMLGLNQPRGAAARGPTRSASTTC